jgi:ubiquinone/menaquinone biosynthesis C-methylase UbiE
MVMDAENLTFPDNSFDKVICIHVMDFLDDPEKATAEILRVLREGGEFIITYPSAKEGRKLGMNILRESIKHRMSLGQNHARAILGSVAQLMMGMAYLPIMLRPKSIVYSKLALKNLISGFTNEFRIEEYPNYCDFIVHGSKSIP